MTGLSMLEPLGASMISIHGYVKTNQGWISSSEVVTVDLVVWTESLFGLSDLVGELLSVCTKSTERSNSPVSIHVNLETRSLDVLTRISSAFMNGGKEDTSSPSQGLLPL